MELYYKWINKILDRIGIPKAYPEPDNRNTTATALEWRLLELEEQWNDMQKRLKSKPEIPKYVGSLWGTVKLDGGKNEAQLWDVLSDGTMIGCTNGRRARIEELFDVRNNEAHNLWARARKATAEKQKDDWISAITTSVKDEQTDHRISIKSNG